MKYIMLHGLGQKASSWQSTVQAMDHRPDILCPDLLEWLHHAEPCYPNLYRAFEQYCGQFHEPFNLCGLSLGGILALQYAIEHSDRVNALALIGAQASMPKTMLNIQNMAFRVMPNSAFRRIGFDKADMIHLCKSMTNLDFRPDLKKIRCRVLVLCGERDRANKPAAWEFKQEIPDAELSMISHAGHEVNVENPFELGEKLNTFFNGDESKR